MKESWTSHGYALREYWYAPGYLSMTYHRIKGGGGGSQGGLIKRCLEYYISIVLSRVTGHRPMQVLLDVG